MFSRIASKLHGEKNALYSLRDALMRRGVPVRDLVSGNINEQGFVFPPDVLEEFLVRGARECAVYRPDSFGRRSAREAVSRYYIDRGLRFDPDSVLLTPGTSLAYWYCFKLLADEGDEILCPEPSYPLFDYIAMLSGVHLVSYRLDERNGWTLDTDCLESNISTRTRAIVLISPHNPTGRILSEEEISRVTEVAVRHDLAIICDEVFSEFLLGDNVLPSPAAGGAPLVFTLNGFSKMFALPGMKFGWMAVSGNPNRVRQALRLLELMSDTFLPVNEIVQAAAPDIFQEGESVRTEFSRRINACWDTAGKCLETIDCFSYAAPQGGFYVTLTLDGIGEEKAAEAALEKNSLLVHPGYFYDMDGDHLVLSFVQGPEVMRSSLDALGKTLSDLKKLGDV